VPYPGEVPPGESLQKTGSVHFLPYMAIFLDKGNATSQKCLYIKTQVGFQPADILPNRFSLFITLMLKGIMPTKTLCLFALDLPEEAIALLCGHERTGRPLRSDSFIDRLEKTSGRIVRRQKPGPKTKQGSK